MLEVVGQDIISGNMGFIGTDPGREYQMGAAEKTEDITVTGNPAVLDNATGKPFKDLHIYGRSEQMTTTGAQLLDASLLKSTSSASVECNGSDIIITALTDGLYRQTSSAPIGFFEEGDQICIAAEAFPKDNVVIIRDSSGATIANVPISNGLQEVVTIPVNGTYYIILCINKGVSVKAGTVGVFSKLIVNKGNASKDYEPYTGGKPSPSPDYPQEIQSAGDDGNLSVIVKNPDNEQIQSVSFSTPNGLPGIPVTSGGNYTDENGQQWICDEVDLGRGVYVQRIGKVTPLSATDILNKLANTEEVRIDNPFIRDRGRLPMLCNTFKLVQVTWGVDTPYIFSYAATDNASIAFRLPIGVYSETYFKEHPTTVYGILATPIKTPLTPAEIAAYKSLRTYRGTTIVEAEDKAGISVTFKRNVKTGNVSAEKKIEESEKKEYDES